MLAGHFEDRPGTWGRQRLPLRMLNGQAPPVPTDR
jgi:hypothetical protein